MTVKLALLKSGEDVIADVQEMVFEDKVIGYIFNKPCNIKMKVREEDSETEKVGRYCKNQIDAVGHSYKRNKNSSFYGLGNHSC